MKNTHNTYMWIVQNDGLQLTSHSAANPVFEDSNAETRKLAPQLALKSPLREHAHTQELMPLIHETHIHAQAQTDPARSTLYTELHS